MNRLKIQLGGKAQRKETKEIEYQLVFISIFCLLFLLIQKPRTILLAASLSSVCAAKRVFPESCKQFPRSCLQKKRTIVSTFIILIAKSEKVYILGRRAQVCLYPGGICWIEKEHNTITVKEDQHRSLASWTNKVISQFE